MYLATYLTFVSSLLWAVVSMATPATQEVAGVPAKDVTAVKQRNPGAVVTTIITIGEIVFNIVSDVMDDIEATETEFVITTLNQLRAQFDDENILVFHDTNSEFTYEGEALYKHVEVDLIEFFGTTKGYEIFVFHRGLFQLAGEGGQRNWGFRGCSNRQDDENGVRVKFLFGDEDGCKPGPPNVSRGTCQQHSHPWIALLIFVPSIILL